MILQHLISPRTPAEFYEAFQKHEPFFVPALGPETQLLRDLPFLKSLGDLLLQWPSPIEAHLPDVRDEASAIETTPRDAQKLFENGMGLLFKEAHKLSPVLQEWLLGLRKDLGFSRMTYGRCMIYATPDGKGTAPHFDQNANFVLQLQGTKTWTMAKNTHVTHPLTRHTMGLEADPELQSYVDAELPLEMPKETQSYTLRPGSLLYVPRGYWHSTEASGSALSLNFTYTAPTWVDLFTAALRSRLIMSPEWRETADLSIETLDELLMGLKHDLPHWQAEDILGATDPID